jgi:hypothetical protein
MELITNSSLLHVSALGCHPQEVFPVYKEHEPTRQSRYCIALVGVIEILRF